LAPASAWAFSNDIIETGIRNLHAVAGRFQRIDQGQPFLVVVDYAHTDDALQNLISNRARADHKRAHHHALRLRRLARPHQAAHHGRDLRQTERPDDSDERQSAAGRSAEKSSATLWSGCKKSGGKYLIEPDRAKAISLAIEEARPGDIVLLAGKGHEDYQILRSHDSF